MPKQKLKSQNISESDWQLITKHINILFSVLNRFFVHNQDKEDIAYEIGLPALINAALNYDDTFGVFIPYASRSIYNAYVNYFKSMKSKNVKTISFEDVPEDFVSTKDEPVVNSLEIKDLMNTKIIPKLNRLSPNAKKCIYYRFFEDMTYKEMSKKIHLSRQRCQQYVKESLEKMRREMPDE